MNETEKPTEKNQVPAQNAEQFVRQYRPLWPSRPTISPGAISNETESTLETFLSFFDELI